jgi:hypothetical protein
MTLDTERPVEPTAPAENSAKPPLHPERGHRLFQTMDELHVRHGNATHTKDRVMRAAVAFIGGSLLFAALYAVILFLE